MHGSVDGRTGLGEDARNAERLVIVLDEGDRAEAVCDNDLVAGLVAEPPLPVPGIVGLLPAQGILFVGGEPKVGKSLLVANPALLLGCRLGVRPGFPVPAARRVLVCQFELPYPAVRQSPGHHSNT